MTSQRPAALIHRAVLRWYSRSGRSFPWRRTRNPYRILLSEIMAQQTQVERVALYYKAWVKRFPDFSSLASAPKQDILRAWSGLGYNNRALRLHQLAAIVVRQYRSSLPRDPESLQQLPGIGRYTAHAVCCFAFGARVPVVDVNIRRIMTRWTRPVRSADEQMPEREAWETAAHFLPPDNAYHWNQALMDLGAMLCTARSPRCTECPVSAHCASADSDVFRAPVRKSTKSEPRWRGIPRRLYRGRILKLLHHRGMTPRAIAAALWEVPTTKDIKWVKKLAERMRADGLLSTQGTSYRIIAS